MSEKLRTSPESHERAPETAESLPETHERAPKRKHEKDPSEMLHEARADIEETANSETRHNPLEDLEESEKAAKPAGSRFVNRELKTAALNRELVTIRRRLSTPARTFSKVVHQPVVRIISEPAAKTVSRPSGLLGGGLVAFLGTTGYLYLAKSAGMQYNYFVFIALFIGGFAVGLMLELLIRLATVHRRQAND